MAEDTALEALRAAAMGLVYTGETDGPLEPFVGGGGGALGEGGIRQQAGVDKDAAVEQTMLDKFFHTVPSSDKMKFQKLAEILKQQLSGVQVYQVGDEAERQAYIVGKAADGRWAGLKTMVVET